MVELKSIEAYHQFVKSQLEEIKQDWRIVTRDSIYFNTVRQQDLRNSLSPPLRVKWHRSLLHDVDPWFVFNDKNSWEVTHHSRIMNPSKLEMHRAGYEIGGEHQTASEINRVKNDHNPQKSNNDLTGNPALVGKSFHFKRKVDKVVYFNTTVVTGHKRSSKKCPFIRVKLLRELLSSSFGFIACWGRPGYVIYYIIS